MQQVLSQHPLAGLTNSTNSEHVVPIRMSQKC